MFAQVRDNKWFRFMELMLISMLMAFLCTTWKPAHADTALTVATGPANGTYHQMFGELNGKCSETMTLNEQVSNGSLNNLALILSNKVNAAIIQEDILFLKKRTESVLNGYRTLFVLHPEEVHFLALAAGKTVTEKEWGGLKNKSVQLPAMNSISELSGKTVAAYGGSVVTAQIIQLQTGINYQVQEVADAAAAVAALNAGQVDAVLAVGGSQLPWVAQLSKGYKLLDVPESVQSRVKDVYQKATLSYPNLGASGVPTIATSAVFVTRQYKTPEYVKSLASLRSCLFSNLDYLKETTGMHAKWQMVKGLEEEGYKGTFTWYDLPSTIRNVNVQTQPETPIKRTRR